MVNMATEISVRKLWNLPKDWKWVKLSDLVSHQTGIWGTPADNYTIAFPTINFTEISGYVLKSESAEMRVVDVKIIDKYSLKNGDILVNKSSGSTRLVGWPCLFDDPNDGRTYLFSNFMLRLRSKGTVIPQYLLYYLHSSSARSVYLYAQATTSGLRNLKVKEFLELSVPIPHYKETTYSLNVQNQIVARIEALLTEIRESRSMLDEVRRDTERLLTVSLNEVFTKLESVIDIVPLSEVATAFNGRASGEGDSDVRVFKTKHVYPHYLRFNNPSYMKEEQVQKLPQDRYLKPGDVLMANIAEGTLGRVSYVKECEDFWTVDTQIMILRSKDEEELLGKWLYYYLWSEQGHQEILSRRTGIAFADKRGQTHIYPKNVVEIPVPKPPIQQQRLAVAYLDNIQYAAEAVLKMLEQDAKSLDMLEQSILERAFRGEL